MKENLVAARRTYNVHRYVQEFFLPGNPNILQYWLARYLILTYMDGNKDNWLKTVSPVGRHYIYLSHMHTRAVVLVQFQTFVAQNFYNNHHSATVCLDQI